MGQLDASIVTVALPTLQKSFHSSVGSVTWVGLSDLVVLVATVTAVGRFADMWGRKLLYVYGFVIFIVASALCGLAPDLAALCVFRALQAVGAAMLQAGSVAIISVVVPRRCPRSGPRVPGRSAGHRPGARAVGRGFAVGRRRVALDLPRQRPLGAFGAVAALLLVPRSVNLQERVAFDWAGLRLFFPAVVAFLTAISFGAAEGWTSPLIVGLIRSRGGSGRSGSCATSGRMHSPCSTCACSTTAGSRPAS